MTRLACALVTVAAALAFSAVPAEAQTISKITIGARTYYTADALSLAGKLPLNPGVRAVLGLVRRCPGVQAYAFLSLSQLDGGIAAWAPNSLLGCLEVSGGGPARNPCLQAGRTPADQDPAGVASRPTANRSFVIFAATSVEACADISTQVPGGVWGQTTAPIAGLPTGSLMLVKCQIETAEGLFDYVAEFRNRVPASKPAYWLHDGYVNTSITRPLRNVPSCSGIDLSF